MNGDDEEGLQEVDDFGNDWSQEGRSVFMFSGCKDEQTSADAFINGRHVGKLSACSSRRRICCVKGVSMQITTTVGAMSWAFLETMKRDFNWNVSYIQVSVYSVDKR